LHLLTKTGHNGKSDNPHKYLENYIENSRRGHKTVDKHISKLIGKEKLDMESDPDPSALRSHLDDLNVNPDKALDIGGQLGSTLPMHAAALGSKAANAINYFNSIKPSHSQISPLDKVTPPTKGSDHAYNRQLSIAENPNLVLHHIKQGTIKPEDIKTLHAIYPSLGQSMATKAGEALIKSQENKEFIPYRQKQGLSDLMGQPLDSLQTPMMMQSIMRANTPDQSQPQKPNKSAIDQVDKTSENLATPDQQRLMDKKS